MTLTGDNGLLTRTVGAKNKTKLAEAQEIASLEYTARLIDSHVDATSISATAEYIAGKLSEDNKFQTDFKPAAGATIATAELYDGETAVTSPIKLKINSEGSSTNAKTLKVKTTTTGGNGTGKYYVIIDGLYHEIIVGNGVTIDKEGKTEASVTNVVTDTRTVKMVISGLDSSTTIQKKIVDEGSTTYENIDENTTFENNDEIRIVAGTAELTGVTIIPKVVNGSTEISVGTTVGVQITAPLGPTVAGTGSTFSTAYGTIEVVWLDQSNNIISSPLVEIPTKEVEIEGQNVTQNLLTPIKLNSDGTYTENPTGSWYNYAEKTATTTSEWANAINPDDDSFFVWIPRYAYRITYYQGDWSTLETTDENYETYRTVTGYYDGYGMWNKEEKKRVRELENGIQTVDDGEKTYIVHPAFETVADLGGGFTKTDGSKIKGIWVAKYEMSMENGSGQHVDTTSSNGNFALSSTVKAVSKPGVSSWRNINIGKCYTNSYNYNREMESHLMKNSEWGAVAYLTHSQYGKNGEEIYINNNKDYLTGYSGESEYSEMSSSTVNTYAYNTTEGAKASSTGNITGIYDLSGGANEYVAAFNKSYSGAYFETNENNQHFASNNGLSTQYATAYNNTTDTYRGIYIYTVGITGDATKEVYKGDNILWGYRNWNGDSGDYLDTSFPFFKRGGFFNDTSFGGVFCSARMDGNANSAYSFRVVLVP